MKGTLGFVDEYNMSMLTDLYELTMCASYFEHKKLGQATFDLFIRRLPPNRSYFLFAGLEQVLLFLEKMRFTEEHIKYLKSLGFKDDFLDYLRLFRFSGDVWAIPEGTVVFPNEPLIRVTAPIIEAQLIETFLLNTINLQTTIATKAARVVYAARGRPVIEFGLRREHGTDAGMKVARASYIAGCSGTSNVLAGMVYGMPVFGTMAHSFVMFFSNELESFRAFAKTFPDKSTLLIDTFDNIAGALNAIKVAKELERQGFKLRGVRIDSGDLVAISREVRRLLNENGLDYVQIFASGDLDEYRIDELLNKGAKIDAFGVGTKMGTSADRPYVDIIYKLCEKADDKGEFVPIMKLSEGKATLPGRKQVYRFTDEGGNFVKDVIALEGEKVGGEPLLVKVMEKGRVIYNLPSLEDIRKRALDNVARLPDKYKRLQKAAKYPVRLSPKLRRLIKELSEKLRETEGAVAGSS
ncbi:MAG: nicotinate phosphoribosyltransferase [Candidatus Bathyarchaeota archaeon]|nr:nicotinate phosphoribosyltransferase [Candidatus Bathyarchaeota archaeon]MDW8040743.1 nicotinate phosphoribosyltransferase [Nitrososphaerota archaeon]